MRPTGLRKNDSYLASFEAKLLHKICEYLPEGLTPDHLTILGLSGAVLAFLAYIGTRFDIWFFWLANLGLLIQWAGDSLDGTFARYTNSERPKYGYFVDCMTDVLCCLLIALGLGISPYVRLDVALFALAGYYMVCIYVFLNHHLNGVHRLSFFRCGPTETRLALIGLNTWMFFGAHSSAMTVFGKSLSIYDVAILLNGVLSVGTFVWLMIRGLELLGLQEQRAKVETIDIPSKFMAKSPVPIKEPR